MFRKRNVNYLTQASTILSGSTMTVNPGSSSLKWSLFGSIDAATAMESGTLPIGDGLGEFPSLLGWHAPAMVIVRFVHGGERFTFPLEVTQDLLPVLEDIESLAPLHNRASLACLRLLLQYNGKIRVLAVFDTEFFHDLPRVSQLYGLPRSLQQKYSIRRYGFHGFAHAAMTDRWQVLCENHGQRLVTMQLGSGCSMAAIKDGRPQDTSMGFTPNEGLLMSTRCGDIDPGLVTWLQRQEGWTPEETDVWLNERSGWSGLSGAGSNFGDLIHSGSSAARDAVDLFLHRARKILGAYYALLGGLDGVLLSGGIAENDISFCEDMLAGLEHLGIEIASQGNKSGMALGAEETRGNSPLHQLTTRNSRVACWVVRGSEDQAMLGSVRKFLLTEGAGL